MSLRQRRQGRVPEALEHYEAALAIAQEVGDRRVEGFWLGSLGLLQHQQGKWEAAGRRFERAVAIGDEAFPLAAGAFRGSLALVRARAEDLAGARALLARGEDQLRDVDVIELGKLLCKKVRVERDAGELATRQAALDEARAIAAAEDAGPETDLG